MSKNVPSLSVNQSNILVFVTACVMWFIMYQYFKGYGYYSFWFVHFEKNSIGIVLATIPTGIFIRWCHAPIEPNFQGIQTFLGTQNGVVWEEGKFQFIFRPLFDIWKKLPIEYQSFTLATENRSKDGHRLLVLATGSALPKNVSWLAKFSEVNFREQVQEQLVGLGMLAIGRYINDNNRVVMLGYQQWDIKNYFSQVLSEKSLFGMEITLNTTKVVEVDPTTARQFDMLARMGDMTSSIQSLSTMFPNLSDAEKYAMYGTLAGINPSVMTHIIKGKGGNHVLLGNNQHI